MNDLGATAPTPRISAITTASPTTLPSAERFFGSTSVTVAGVDDFSAGGGATERRGGGGGQVTS